MIKDFSEIRKEDVESAGGKGANLGEMTSAGFLIPRGFVVLSDAYRSFIKSNGLESFIEESLENAAGDLVKLTESAKSIREKIKEASFPEELAEKIVESYRDLGDNARVAVRSSATAEDLPDASFAGQQETYLNVRGTEELLRQVKNCYTSLWGTRAVYYRENQGYDHSKVALAVVVQEMVESEKAGVLFTVNPLNNSHDEMQINASYGLGESVVSGRVTADSYTCDRSGVIKNVSIGTKKTQIIYDEKGTKEIEVSEELQKANCLTSAEVAELVMQGCLIEKHYGMPMDIEWGIAGGKVYILQARAITTVSEKEADDDKVINSYLEKCKCSPVMKKNLKFLFEKIPEAFYPLDDYMVGAVNEQKSVIFREAGIELYMQPQLDDEGITILPKDKKRLHREILKFPGLVKELKNYPHCRRVISKRMAEHKRELESIVNADYSKMTFKEAFESFTNIHDYVAALSYDRFKYALFPSAFFKGKIKKVVSKIDKNLTEEDFYNNLDYRTAVISKSIVSIAKKIRSDEKMTNAILNGISYDRLIAEYPSIKPEFEGFLRENGYKTDFNCYCILAKSYIDEPDRLLNIVRPLLNGDLCADEDKFAALMGKIKDVCSEGEFEELKQDIDDFRYFHVVREESQYYWESAFFYAREALKRISSLLYGTENFRENVAYLFYAELKDAADKGVISAELQKKIDRRKANRPLAEKIWQRCKLLVFGKSGSVLKGVGGSRGEAVGTVKVIRSPKEFYKMQQGDVLVCQYTDPEWTPLFKMASAVVADTGASLSHAAIVAREYGIPAVLGVGYATQRFNDGDTIRVDGSKGEVSKIA